MKWEATFSQKGRFPFFAPVFRRSLRATEMKSQTTEQRLLNPASGRTFPTGKVDCGAKRSKTDESPPRVCKNFLIARSVRRKCKPNKRTSAIQSPRRGPAAPALLRKAPPDARGRKRGIFAVFGCIGLPVPRMRDARRAFLAFSHPLGEGSKQHAGMCSG